jgi:hypothetical protein
MRPLFNECAPAVVHPRSGRKDGIFWMTPMNASVGLKPPLRIKLYRISRKIGPSWHQRRAQRLFTPVVGLIERRCRRVLRDRYREDAVFIDETR